LTNEIGTLEVEKLYNETCYENDKHLIKDKIMGSNLNEGVFFVFTMMLLFCYYLMCWFMFLDKLTKMISSANTSAGDSL